MWFMAMKFGFALVNTLKKIPCPRLTQGHVSESNYNLCEVKYNCIRAVIHILNPKTPNLIQQGSILDSSL